MLKFKHAKYFARRKIRTHEISSKSNNKIVKHFSECEANGCVEPIGSLPDPRGDSIHVHKCTDSINATHPRLNLSGLKFRLCARATKIF